MITVEGAALALTRLIGWLVGRAARLVELTTWFVFAIILVIQAMLVLIALNMRRIAFGASTSESYIYLIAKGFKEALSSVNDAIDSVDKSIDMEVKSPERANASGYTRSEIEERYEQALDELESAEINGDKYRIFVAKEKVDLYARSLILAGGSLDGTDSNETKEEKEEEDAGERRDPPIAGGVAQN